MKTIEQTERPKAESCMSAQPGPHEKGYPLGGTMPVRKTLHKRQAIND